MAHAFDHRNASLSEGEVLAVVVQAVPGNPHWTRVGTDSPHRLRQPWRGGGWRVPASPGAPRREGEEVVRATPRFLALVRHRGGEMVHAKIHHLPSPSGVALSTVVPGGKAMERCPGLRPSTPVGQVAGPVIHEAGRTLFRQMRECGLNAVCFNGCGRMRP